MKDTETPTFTSLVISTDMSFGLVLMHVGKHHGSFFFDVVYYRITRLLMILLFLYLWGKYLVFFKVKFIQLIVTSFFTFERHSYGYMCYRTNYGSFILFLQGGSKVVYFVHLLSRNEKTFKSPERYLQTDARYPARKRHGTILATP